MREPPIDEFSYLNIDPDFMDRIYERFKNYRRTYRVETTSFGKRSQDEFDWFKPLLAPCTTVRFIDDVNTGDPQMNQDELNKLEDEITGLNIAAYNLTRPDSVIPVFTKYKAKVFDATQPNALMDLTKRMLAVIEYVKQIPAQSKQDADQAELFRHLRNMRVDEYLELKIKALRNGWVNDDRYLCFEGYVHKSLEESRNATNLCADNQ